MSVHQQLFYPRRCLAYGILCKTQKRFCLHQLFCNASCHVCLQDHVLHLDLQYLSTRACAVPVQAYNSLCFTCTRIWICSTAACAVPEGVWSIQPHVLHLDVRVSASICSTVVWVVQGAVWPTAAFANLIDVAVYSAAPVVHAFYAGPGRITKLLFYRKPFWLLSPLNEDINLKRLSLKWRGKTYFTKVPTYRYSISHAILSNTFIYNCYEKKITKL